MKNQTCCFTGHRSIPECKKGAVTVRLSIELRRLILAGYRYFGAGGALGFDTLAAQTILKLQQEFPHIRLILVLPCRDQASRWSESSRSEYEEIKRRANKVVYISDRYTKDCMFRRNRHLVDYSSVCLCFLERQTGGTAYTVQYAMEQGVRVINIADGL